MPQIARNVTTTAITETVEDTINKRSNENGVRNLPLTLAVKAKPKIIISQTHVAAAAFFLGSTRFARRTNNAVPLELTPIPIIKKATVASAIPNPTELLNRIVEAAAKTPPLANTNIPPRIHGLALRV